MEFPRNKKRAEKLTPLAALEKIKNWCAYQERSPKETSDKLFEYGLTKAEAEQVLTTLIEENFLNEERFASAFARGKFRIKKWGKLKIKAELKARRISDYSIKKALGQIDEVAYEETIRSIIEKKSRAIKESNAIRKNYKLLQYAAAKGFEKDIIADILKQQMEQTETT